MHPRPSLLARVGRSGAAVGALLLAAAACGGDGGTGPTADAAGRYEIVQVNDDVTSPFLLLEEVSQGSTLRVEIVSGVFDLRRDGEYSSVGRLRLTFDGEVTEETGAPQTGRFRVSGSTVTFDPAGNDPDEPNFTGIRDGDTLTFEQQTTDPGTGETFSIRLVARR